MKQDTYIILVIDKNKSILSMLETILKQENYQVITARDFKTAQEAIIANHKNLSAIILNKIIEEENGFEIIKWIKAAPITSKIPIIMQVSSNKPELIIEGIDAGVFYCITKPIKPDILKSIVRAALSESKQYKILTREINQHCNSFKLLENALFKIYNLQDAENISSFISNAFPSPDKILPAISALLINAVEYGICQISYNDKSTLIANGKWREEIDRKTKLENDKNKYVEVIFTKENNKYIIKISDPGQGFAWQKFINLDASRALDNHGRGVAVAKMLFDTLEYNKQGNQVIGIVNQSKAESFKW